jgi:hypothetical protein
VPKPYALQRGCSCNPKLYEKHTMSAAGMRHTFLTMFSTIGSSLIDVPVSLRSATRARAQQHLVGTGNAPHNNECWHT